MDYLDMNIDAGNAHVALTAIHGALDSAERRGNTSPAATVRAILLILEARHLIPEATTAPDNAPTLAG